MYIKSLLKRLWLGHKVQAASNDYWHGLEAYNYQQVFPQRYQAQVDFTRQYLMPRMKPTDRVVDIGCGDGWHSLELARHCGQLHGYDFSGNLVKLANEQASAQGLAERCRFEVADVLTLRLPADSADIVLLCGIMTCLIADNHALRAANLAASAVRAEGYALYKDTLHRGMGTHLNYVDGYGAAYRDRSEYLGMIEQTGMRIIADAWIDVTDEYGSLMVLASKSSK
jgi:SAM-dependent methyltransferase